MSAQFKSPLAKKSPLRDKHLCIGRENEIAVPRTIPHATAPAPPQPFMMKSQKVFLTILLHINLAIVRPLVKATGLFDSLQHSRPVWKFDPARIHYHSINLHSDDVAW